MRSTINTPRLQLICCDQELLEAILSGDNSISKLLNVNAVPEWSFGGEPAFRFSLNQIINDPESKSWMTYLTILKNENKLVGAGGYQGKPDVNGIVEIGYGIAPTYQNKKIATEMAQALVEHAFKFDEVKVVMAHTLAEENASVKILRKCGMEFITEVMHPEDGLLWRWEIKKIA